MPEEVSEEINENEITFSKEVEFDYVQISTLIDDSEVLDEELKDSVEDLKNSIPPPLRKKSKI